MKSELPLILEDYLRQVETLKAEVKAMAASVPEEQLSRRPEPSRWSAIENVDHLRATVQQYLPALDTAMAEASKCEPAENEPRYGFIWRIFLSTLEPPVRRRFRAPKSFLPQAQTSAVETLDGFLAAHDALIERIHRAAEYDLKSVKVTSPATPLLKPPLGCVLAMMAAHGRRHLWQARRAIGPA